MPLGTDRNFQGAMSYSHDLLVASVRLLPPRWIWRLSAIDPAQPPGTTHLEIASAAEARDILGLLQGAA